MPILKYGIDPALLSAGGKDFGFIIWDRVCDKARADFDNDWRKINELKFSSVRSVIRKHCSNDPEYISAGLPLREAVFRLLLIAPVDQVPLEIVHSVLSKIWATALWPRHLSLDTLQRTLVNSAHQGIVEFAYEDTDEIPKDQDQASSD